MARNSNLKLPKNGRKGTISLTKMNVTEFFEKLNESYPAKRPQACDEDENPVPAKKKSAHPTFERNQDLKISKKNVEVELSNFSRNHHNCLHACKSKLTIQCVMFCRSKFVLLKNFKEQREWLHNELNRSQKVGERNQFFVEVPSIGPSRVCRQAFCLAYGMQMSWLKRNVSIQNSTLIPVSKPIRREGWTDPELLFIEWLKREAQKVGDKLPHGDGLFLSGSSLCSANNKVEIRLPYPNKQVMHSIYEIFITHGEGNEGEVVLPYQDAVSVWKNHPELHHIKLIKHKKGFSKCNKCLEYGMKIKKPMTAAQRQHLDQLYFGHLVETRKERSQYAKQRIKAIEPAPMIGKQVTSVIMDSIDKWKTTFPFFVNLPKSIGEGTYLFKTKMTACMFHGIGVYCFWASEQIVHDTNLSVECILRALKKVHSDLAPCALPRKLALQLDNASDNKSKHFLAVMAYLVEIGAYDVIKLSYLIVAHTHEDVDQWFSVYSRFLKKVLMQVLTISAFVQALMSAFKTPKCIPKCVERIEYCYDTSILLQYLDKNLARFDLDEKTEDKVHHFTFRRNVSGKCVMQYKLKRYSNALYPRAYNVGSKYMSDTKGEGQVITAQPSRDILTKEKFWEYKVQYNDDDGNLNYELIKLPAKDCAIVMFPDIEPEQLPKPDSFPIASFSSDFSATVPDLKKGIASVFRALQLQQTHAEELQWWNHFLDTIPLNPHSVTQHPFWVPPVLFHTNNEIACATRTNFAVHIDDGVRPIDVVTHAQFTGAMRRRAIAMHETQIVSAQRLDKLSQGNFVVVQFVVENAAWYKWKFVIGEIYSDISGIDSTSPDADIPILIYRPAGSTTHLSIDKKFIPWKGDDNSPFYETVKRSTVSAIVELNKLSKTLTKKSRNLICSKML